MIEKWTGSSWFVWNSGGPPGSTSSELFGVSCLSETTFCMAVGQYTSNGNTFPLVYTWGTTTGPVTQLTAPSAGPYGNYFTSVSCQSASSCVLVGPLQNAIWNGSTFTSESLAVNPVVSAFFPYPGVLLAVSCATAQPGFCTEVGFAPAPHDTNEPVAESSSGGPWNLLSNDFSGKFLVEPPNARSATLTSVFCITAQLCQAVGNDQDATTNAPGIWGAALTGQGWKLESLPPAGAELVSDVNCPNDCWAVGQYATPSGPAPFADDISGTQAAFSTLPTPPGRDPLLSSISCAQDNYCEAVGSYYSNATDTQVAFAERYSYTPPSGPGKCPPRGCPLPRAGIPRHYALQARGTEARGATIVAELHKPRTLVLLVRSVRHHRPVIVGLVALGAHRPGTSRIHWNLRVGGARLRPGTYEVSLHAIAAGLIGPSTPPGEITLTVRAHGRVRIG